MPDAAGRVLAHGMCSALRPARAARESPWAEPLQIRRQRIRDAAGKKAQWREKIEALKKEEVALQPQVDRLASERPHTTSRSHRITAAQHSFSLLGGMMTVRQACLRVLPAMHSSEDACGARPAVTTSGSVSAAPSVPQRPNRRRTPGKQPRESGSRRRTTHGRRRRRGAARPSSRCTLVDFAAHRVHTLHRQPAATPSN